MRLPILTDIFHTFPLCWPPLWSSGRSSWLQIQMSGLDSRLYQIFWRVWSGVHSASWVQLRSYLEEKVAAPVQKTEITAVGDSPRWPRNTPSPQNLSLTSTRSGSRSVSILCSRTQATEFVLFVCCSSMLAESYGIVFQIRKLRFHSHLFQFIICI
jgi:hypothetical protein